MKILNTGSKVVNIGTTVLLPGKDMTCNKAIAEAPSIKALVEKGFLTVIDEPKQSARGTRGAAPKAPAAPAETATPAPTPNEGKDTEPTTPGQEPKAE